MIGCEGVAFEVRGWNYESGMIDVDQAHTLVIGIMGNIYEIYKINMYKITKF